MEYGFGAHEYPTSGVFEVEPKSCPGFIFRRSVCVGSTDMSRSQVRTAIEDLAEDYHGDTYHLIIKNCNHFTADVCKLLTGKPVPGWVNRLARLGYFLFLYFSLLQTADPCFTMMPILNNFLLSQVLSSTVYCLKASRSPQSEAQPRTMISLVILSRSN